MLIKAQAILNAAGWVKSQHGQAAYSQVLKGCSPVVRERCASAIAINWHPVEEFLEFLAAAEQIVGSGSGTTATSIGEAGARAHTRGALVRMAFWVAKPEFLMKRAAGLWRQFNDEGEMIVLQVDHELTRFELKNVSRPDWLFCCTVTGWGRVMGEAAGMKNPIARHTECRARNAARCIWEIVDSKVS